MDELLVRYLHFIGIISLASGLVVEQFLISKKVSIAEMKKIANADALCGVASLLILCSGLLLWLVVGKPADFYSGSWVFQTKLILFLSIIILAIRPALFFIKNRNSQSSPIKIPQTTILLVRLELVIFFGMPLLTVFMAKGYGI